MAKVQLNPLLLEVRGRIGDWVFRRVGRDTIVSRRPRRRQRPPTPNQLRQRRHFRDAMAYGRAVARDPQLRCRYVAAAKARLTSVYVCALTDFLNPPRIRRVDGSRYTGRAGQSLAIHAEDNFGVRSVAVRITHAAGGEIEAGPAVRDARTGTWRYRARQTVMQPGTLRVEIVVTDHPGHTATQSIEIQRQATGGCRRTRRIPGIAGAWLAGATNKCPEQPARPFLFAALRRPSLAKHPPAPSCIQRRPHSQPRLLHHVGVDLRRGHIVVSE